MHYTLDGFKCITYNLLSHMHITAWLIHDSKSGIDTARCDWFTDK